MFLQIISASITPAVLILAAGSLVNSTLTRLGRIVDHARVLVERLEAERCDGSSAKARATALELRVYARRADLTERALSLYYVSIGLFVAGALAIALDELTHDSLPWLSLLLVVGGGALLFVATAALVVETNIATGSLRHEIDSACVGETSPPPLSVFEAPRQGSASRSANE